MISLANLKQLIQDSHLQRRELQTLYDRLPRTRCRRLTRCCSLLPEMTLLEALQAFQTLMEMTPDLRMALIKKTIRYFLINSAEITACPFLKDQDCLIYEDRFFGCRAYGLWSPEYYNDLVEKNRRSKDGIGEQWEKLGVILPEEVLKFSIPYCSQVEALSLTPLGDEPLRTAATAIEGLSESFTPWHTIFRDHYFSDFAFLLAGMTFGLRLAVGYKFQVIREVVGSGNRRGLEELLTQPLNTSC